MCSDRTSTWCFQPETEHVSQTATSVISWQVKPHPHIMYIEKRLLSWPGSLHLGGTAHCPPLINGRIHQLDERWLDTKEDLILQNFRAAWNTCRAQQTIFFFKILHFLIYYDFFSFSLTWGPHGRKNFKQHLL